MPFRADEEAIMGQESAIRFLISRLPQDVRASSLEGLHRIIDRYGPVVDAYPTWHPFVWGAKHHETKSPIEDGRYKGLDHVVHLKNAFISCPYSDEEGEALISSALDREPGPFASIGADVLEFPLYVSGTTAVLVTCEWSHPATVGDTTIHQRHAIGRMLANEIPCLEHASVAETWEDMRPYLLGSPHGSRSSLFVSEATGSAMKRVWNAIMEAGVYGPFRATTAPARSRRSA